MEQVSEEQKLCKCGNPKCTGFYLLHEKELADLEKKKEEFRKTEPTPVTFELVRSPSSGEIFTKFYELHVIEAKEAEEPPLGAKICLALFQNLQRD